MLDVDAKAADGFNLNSYDISLGYDKDRFEVLDVGINGSFNFFNSAELDAENGSVRVVGGSAGNLAEGVGSGTADGNTFQLLLKAIHDNTHNSKDSIDVGFTAKVNSNDTVLADGENIVNGSSGELTSTYSFANSFVEFDVQNDIAFATERSIGIGQEDQAYTSLIREGARLDGLGSVDLKTLGNITATYKATIEQESASRGLFSVDFTGENTSDSEASTWYSDYVTGYASHQANSVDDYKMRISVSEGIAGQVLDLSDVTIKVADKDDANKYSTSTTLSGKNLITYQSDINYDGRVSMMDLAYLNAGAGKTYGDCEDVDVNYDKTIDLKDLAKMDAQWGSSLHSNNAISNDLFTGTGDSTINLTGISLGGNYGTADNSAFIGQNSTENTSGFVDTLADAGSAGYSADGISAPYGELHDASAVNTPEETS